MLHARTLTPDEIETLRKLVTSGPTSVRTLKRAYIIWRSTQGVHVPAIAQELGMNEGTVRLWIKRFNCDGLPGLLDLPRPGRKQKYTRDLIAHICKIAATLPADLGLPFKHWTLNRLLDYLREQGITARRSQLHNLLRANNVAWHQKLAKTAQRSNTTMFTIFSSSLLVGIFIPDFVNIMA